MQKIAGKSLQEIIELPRSETLKILRKHVHRDWGKPGVAPEEPGKRVYGVNIDYTYMEELSDGAAYEIEAASKEEAEEKALELFREEMCFVEITGYDFASVVDVTEE